MRRKRATKPERCDEGTKFISRIQARPFCPCCLLFLGIHPKALKDISSQLRLVSHVPPDFLVTRQLRADPCPQGKRIHDVVNRMHVANPKPRDAAARPPVIPPSVAAARAASAAEPSDRRRTEKDLEARSQSLRLWIRYLGFSS